MEKVIYCLVLISIISCNGDKEIEYYENGSIKYEIDLKNGIRDGEMTSYYQNGKIKGIANFKNGKLSGIAISYDSITGHKLSEIHYDNDKKDGLFLGFYSGGEKKIKGYFKNDMPDSIGFEYYPDGKISKHYYYQQGEIFYFKALDTLGKFYDTLLPISIKELGRNENGDSIAFEIRLDYSIYDSVRVGAIIGPLDSNNNLIDSLYVTGSSDKSTNLIGSTKEMESGFSGILFEIKMPEEIIMGRYWFKYPNPDSTNITKL